MKVNKKFGDGSVLNHTMLFLFRTVFNLKIVKFQLLMKCFVLIRWTQMKWASQKVWENLFQIFSIVYKIESF
jgi:hypothetical protein